MSSFTIITTVDNNNFISKYETASTLKEANVRLNAIQQIPEYANAFVVENNKVSPTGEMCFQTPTYFPVDVVNKAISFNQSAYDAGQVEVVLARCQRDRASAYPSLQDQADMAYWDRQNGTTTLDDAITAVKTAYPKT